MSDETRVLIKGADRDGIPLDVFGSITGAIGVLYPNAKMGPGEYGNGVTLVVSPEDRRNTVKGRKRAIAAKRQAIDPDEPQAGVLGWDGESLRTVTPPEAAEVLLRYGLAFIEGTEGAVNNVTQRAMLPDGRGLLLTVQWLHGKSPAEQRDEARARVTAALDTMVEAFGRDFDGDDLRSLAGVSDAQGHALSAAALRALATLADGEAPRE